MTFPEQLHAIINDPVKEKAVLELIRVECMKEYAKWNDLGGSIEVGAIAASSNLLCRFMGLIKEKQ